MIRIIYWWLWNSPLNHQSKNSFHYRKSTNRERKSKSPFKKNWHNPYKCYGQITIDRRSTVVYHIVHVIHYYAVLDAISLSIRGHHFIPSFLPHQMIILWLYNDAIFVHTFMPIWKSDNIKEPYERGKTISKFPYTNILCRASGLALCL